MLNGGGPARGRYVSGAQLQMVRWLQPLDAGGVWGQGIQNVFFRCIEIQNVFSLYSTLTSTVGD